MQHGMNGRSRRALCCNAAHAPAALGYTSAHSCADLHTRMAECDALHAADAEGGRPPCTSWPTAALAAVPWAHTCRACRAATQHAPLRCAADGYGRRAHPVRRAHSRSSL
jgi:hypothetical protein